MHRQLLDAEDKHDAVQSHVVVLGDRLRHLLPHPACDVVSECPVEVNVVRHGPSHIVAQADHYVATCNTTVNSEAGARFRGYLVYHKNAANM